MKKTLTLLAILALGLTACNKVELQNSSEQIPEIPAEAPACYFKLSAAIENDPETKSLTLGESTASFTFEASDSVYVYIVGQGTNAGTIACGKDKVNNRLASLTMENINGASCDLSGALKFYYEDSYFEVPYTPAVGDVVHLYYNMRFTHFPFSSYYDYSLTHFSYGNQSGDKDGYLDPGYGFGYPELWYWGANHYDLALAQMEITDVAGNTTDGFTLTLGKVDDPTNPKASFQNMQSMFRQRLTFTDQLGNPTTPWITRYRISSASDKTVLSYRPYSTAKYVYGAIEMEDPVISGDEGIHFALMFNDENKNDALIQTAYDNAHNAYVATKTAPAGGFLNGKYYHGNATLAWHHSTLPSVTGNNAPYTTYAPDGSGKYEIDDNPGDITVSGYSEEDNWIALHQDTNVTLDNITASFYTRDAFIYGFSIFGSTNLNLILSGTNSIDSHSMYLGIQCLSDVLLSCAGASATLTLRCGDERYCGIQAHNYDYTNSTDPYYNCYYDTSERDVSSLLAAPGFTVTRSARVDGPDLDLDGYPDYYTWTYTVEDHRVHLNSLTSSYTAQDGDVLTGELPGNLELNIASGATVTLAGMTHHAGHYINGISCEGSANIILAEGTTNDLTKGDEGSYLGILIDCSGAATLTISGTGTLLASGGVQCAGIGSRRATHNIVINGGNITATGGHNAPGIGSCNNALIGNITINGGTVTATGSSSAAGIGAAVNGSHCTGITIGSDITSVSIRKGQGASVFFSADGANSVTIDGQNSFLFATSTTQFPNLDSTLSTTTDMDDTWTLTHK